LLEIQDNDLLISHKLVVPSSGHGSKRITSWGLNFGDLCTHASQLRGRDGAWQVGGERDGPNPGQWFR
jgi:hypothetical protein